MPEDNQFFDVRSFARRIKNGDIKPKTAIVAVAKTIGLFGFTTGITLRIRVAAALDKSGDPLLGPRYMSKFGEGLLERMNFASEVGGAYPPASRLRQSDGKPRGRLVVCNHRSHLDVPCIGRLVTVFMVGTAMAKSWPILGKGGELAGVLYVDRTNPDSRDHIKRVVMEKLDAGLDVLNFPEGANFDGPGMAPFKSGLFRMLAGKEVDIVPMVLRYPPGSGIEWVGDDPEAAANGDRHGLDNRKSFIEHFIDLMTGPSMTVKSHFGELIDCAAYDDPMALMEAVRGSMLHDLDLLDGKQAK